MSEDTAIKRWHLPDVKGQSAQTDVHPFVPLSANELQLSLEDSQQQGYDKGFAQGIEEGKAQAYEEAKAQAETHYQNQWQQQLAILQDLIKILSHPTQIVTEAFENDLNSVILSIAKNICRVELNTQPEAIIPLVKDAIQLIASQHGAIELKLHPEDMNVLTDTLQAQGMEHELKIIQDDTLARGTCHVSTAESSVDASLEQRIQTLCTKVFEHAHA